MKLSRDNLQALGTMKWGEGQQPILRSAPCEVRSCSRPRLLQRYLRQQAWHPGEGVSQGTNEPHKGAQSSDSQQQRQGKGASPTGQQDKGTAQRQDKGTSGQQGAQGDQGKGASPTGQQAKGPAQRQDKAAGAQGDQGKGAS